MTWTIATDDGQKPHTECQFRFSETRHFTCTVGRERKCGEYTAWMCGNPAAIGSPCASFACILYCGSDVEADAK